MLGQEEFLTLFSDIFYIILGAKPITFPCFIAIIILGSVILTPLFSLFYITRGFGICCSHYFKNLDNII